MRNTLARVHLPDGRLAGVAGALQVKTHGENFSKFQLLSNFGVTTN